MKTRITLALVVLLTSLSFAQQGINYKAIIKDDSGNVIAIDLIVVQFTILKGVGMSNVYLETHTPTTDANGLIVVNIGEGITSDVFTDIDWGSDDHYLNVQINTGGGLVDMGTTQFMAVPYALSVSKEVLKIDDLSDGKSDSDGSNDGSSVFLGLNAGASDDGTDNGNVGVGFQSLYSNTTGNKNTALGFESDYYNQEGNFNTILGYRAGNGKSNHTKSGNIFLGYQAGYHETGNNKLYVHNDSISNPLIYGEFDNEILRVNGKLEVTGDIMVQDSGNPSPEPGTIRWNNSSQDFEGFTGMEWKSLTKNSELGNSINTPNHNIQASDGILNDRFGWSVSISGDYAIVGSNQGKAYIFHQSGASWTEQAILITSDGVLGSNVSISGDYAIIGGQEKAYIFYRSETSWTEQPVLTASDGVLGDGFGATVSISGEYAIVAAIGFNSNQGKAYIFYRSGTSWTEQAILLASDGAADNFFGASVSISGDYAIVGAPIYFNSSHGKAYIFLPSATIWTEEAILIASDATVDDNFGGSVSISGDYAIVGAFGNGDGGPNSGSAYIFVRSGTIWTEQAKLNASDAAAGDQFGGHVSISGDYAIVGAEEKGFHYVEGVFVDLLNGAAYIYHRVGTSWSEVSILNLSDKTGVDHFGKSVSISENFAIVGSRGNDFFPGQISIFNY